jgi:hypothetical protein
MAFLALLFTIIGLLVDDCLKCQSIVFKEQDMDFPFCLIWANEKWTRRWDGWKVMCSLPKTTPRTLTGHLSKTWCLLRDDRYIRINGRPIIIVYRTDILPEPLPRLNDGANMCDHSWATLI